MSKCWRKLTKSGGRNKFPTILPGRGAPLRNAGPEPILRRSRAGPPRPPPSAPAGGRPFLFCADAGTLGGMDSLPLDEIDAIFLDLGNTLVSMDFDLIGARLASRGLNVATRKLVRAEAAARPIVSGRVARGASSEGIDPFRFYLGAVLAGLDVLSERDCLEWASQLALELKRDVPTSRLWSGKIDGVEESLASFSARGLMLAVVSNSDGSAEDCVIAAGVRKYFSAVVDSGIVGIEKPDPEIFRHAMRLVGARSSRTLYVGDLYDVDIVGARAAGLHALLLDPFGDWEYVDCPRAVDLRSLAAHLAGPASSGAP